MGIENRDYYRDEYERQPMFGFGEHGAGGPRSVVVWLIIINVAVWVIGALTPRNEVLPTAAFREMDRNGNEKIEKGDPIEEGLYYRYRSADRNGDLYISEKEFVDDKAQPYLTDYLALPTDFAKRPWEVWRFLTHGFTHDKGLYHILFNMLALFMLGRAVEQRLGSEEFLKFYLLALLFAGIVWLLVSILRSTNAYAVGASGAVTATVGLFIFFFPHQKLLLFFVIPVRAWVLGILILVPDVIRAFSSNSSVAGEAHLAGFAFAAAYFYFKWNFHWIKLDYIKDRMAGKPNLKVHDPDKPSAAAAKLSEQADEILKKVHEEGEESLTRKERNILIKHSREVRKNKK